jgi:oxygen-independent coproporphyrinogen-3 oxidase
MMVPVQQQQSLFRIFQGYTTHAQSVLIRFAITAIGNVGDAYVHNVPNLSDDTAALLASELRHGMELNADDKLRREIIAHLMCNFYLDIAAVELHFGIDFTDYFHAVFPELAQFARDGLLTYNWNYIEVFTRRSPADPPYLYGL